MDTTSGPEPDSWHNQMSVLFQDYADYHFVVKDVIAMGRRNGSPATGDGQSSSGRPPERAEAFIAEWAGQYEQMVGREFPTASTFSRASSRSWPGPVVLPRSRAAHSR